MTLSHGSDDDIVVNWQTSDGTATAGSDYVVASGTLTILARDLQATVEYAAWKNRGGRGWWDRLCVEFVFSA